MGAGKLDCKPELELEHGAEGEEETVSLVQTNCLERLDSCGRLSLS